jgi:hypothetical protein
MNKPNNFGLSLELYPDAVHQFGDDGPNRPSSSTKALL